MLAAATAIHNDAKRFVLRVGRDGSARIRTVELLRPVDKERCVHTVFLDKGFHRRTGPLVIRCSPHVCVCVCAVACLGKGADDMRVCDFDYASSAVLLIVSFCLPYCQSYFHSWDQR